MWVEDRDGLVEFDPSSRVVALATWRRYSTMTPDPTFDNDGVHGRLVVEFDGAEGTHDFGRLVDFSGRYMVVGSPQYEVAALSVTVTTTTDFPPPGAWAVRADYWLLAEDLAVVPADVCPGATSTTRVFIFAAPRPLYKRIQPQPRSQIAFRVEPLYTSSPPPNTAASILSTKLVLRIRRCRTKSVRA
jgi:hypothetical protein